MLGIRRDRGRSTCCACSTRAPRRPVDLSGLDVGLGAVIDADGVGHNRLGERLAAAVLWVTGRALVPKRDFVVSLVLETVAALGAGLSCGTRTAAASSAPTDTTSSAAGDVDI